MLAGALELFLVSLGLTYYVATVGAGLRIIRRSRKARRAQAARAALEAQPAGRAARSGGARAARRAGPGRRPGHRGGHGLAAAASPASGTAGAAEISGPAASGPAAELAASVSAGWGRLRTKLDTADDPPARAGVLIPAQDCVVYFVIPCLNEELVIGDTVRDLLADPRGLAVVVDDASDDRTAELALAAGGDRVMIVRRELPEARRGKGPALNAGFAHVLHDAGVRGISSSRITVCVMDADGRLSEGALDVVLPLFEDPQVGGVQLPVRIRNRNSLLTVMQDLEFWGVCAVAQLGRMASGTVSLGGNGQFTRLAALLEIGPAPWQAQLTEDLDLSLALAAKGWRLTSAPDAHVSQQGVTSLRALINQRTRWYQGHMQAVRWLRELWTSRQLSHLAMLELTIYLLVPWALVLPWSIIFNYNLLIMVLWVLGWVATPGLGNDWAQKIATLGFWYTLSCLPIYMAGFLYGRQERKVGYVRAFFIGHLLLVGNYVTYAACWRAMYRLITGSHGWVKTRRTDERHRSGARPAAVPAPAGPVPALLVPAAAPAELPAGASVLPVLSAAPLAASALTVAALAAATHPAVPLTATASAADRYAPAASLAGPYAGAPAGAAWSVAARPAGWPPAGPLAVRFADSADLADSLGHAPAESVDSHPLVPRQRVPDLAELGADPEPAGGDQDATTTNLPVITEPRLAAPVSRTAPGGGADGAGAAGTGAGGTGANGAWDRLAAAWDEAGSASGGGVDLARELPVRRPAGRPGHSQPRRAAGSHRATRVRPAQRSGR